MRVQLENGPEPWARNTVARLRHEQATEVQALMVRVDNRRYSLVVSRDPIGQNGSHDFRWHLSLAGESSLPRWGDLVAVAHHVRPGVPFVVGIPPRSQWMNAHPYCLHLMETKDENLLEQWKFEGQGHKPT